VVATATPHRFDRLRAIVPLQREGNWAATGEILAASAQRLERAGATVLASAPTPCTSTSLECKTRSPCPSLTCVTPSQGITGSGHDTIGLLGTKYLIEGEFYSDRLRELASRLSSDEEQTERLQFIIFSS